MNTSSLDDILQEIEKAPTEPPVQSAGMMTAPDYLSTNRDVGHASPMQWASQPMPSVGSSLLGGGVALSRQMDSSSLLSPNQRRLPKINIAMFGSVMAIMVMVVGVGSAVRLAQQNQDIRQQAYEGQSAVRQGNVVKPTISPSITTKISEKRTNPVAVSQSLAQPTTLFANPFIMIGAAVIVIALFSLVALLWWLFRF